MNLSEYTEHDRKLIINSGKLSLMKDMKVINATEEVYRFLGQNSARSFTALIHPEDLEEFNSAVGMLREKPQHLVLRVMDCRDVYRYMYMILSYSDRVEEDFRIIDIDIQDLLEAHKHYDSIHSSVFKYRKFMTFSSNIYMEYYYENRFLNIFEYKNGRGYVLYAHDIDIALQLVEDDIFLDSAKKEDFRQLYDMLINGIDNIDVYVDGTVFGMEQCDLHIKGGILFEDNKKYMLAATVKKMNSGESKEEKFYMTSYAIDAATGTYNKRAITEICSDMLKPNSDGDMNTHFLCMMDVDDFKAINDTYGHMTGDEVMARVAGTVRDVIGDRGFVGRFGGDEYLVLTDKVSDKEELINLLKTIRKNMIYSCKDINPNLNVTFSIGIAKYPDHGTSYEKLFGIADRCVYIAKEKGKNRYIAYEPEIHGDFNMEEHISGSGNVMTSSTKYYGDVCNIMHDINSYGADGIQECMDNIRNAFDIDGVSIFDNATGERKYSSGTYLNPYGVMDFVTELQNKWDANGVFSFNKVLTIADQLPKTYEKLKNQGNSGCMLMRGKRYTVEYDVFDRPRKWTENDKGMLMIVGKMIDENI